MLTVELGEFFRGSRAFTAAEVLKDGRDFSLVTNTVIHRHRQ
jgi:hypothetical protein